MYEWSDFITGEIKFHIDHKNPKVMFSYTKPEDEDFKKCWALENLRLITAQEKLSKGKGLMT